MENSIGLLFTLQSLVSYIYIQMKKVTTYMYLSKFRVLPAEVLKLNLFWKCIINLGWTSKNPEPTVPGTVWGTPRETDTFFHLFFDKFYIQNIKFTYISYLNSLIFQAENYFWISSKLLSLIALNYIAYNQRSQ